MSTAAEQAADRHYPFDNGWELGSRRAFVAGAEWSEKHFRDDLERYRELLEAAREWLKARREYAGRSDSDSRVILMTATERLTAAAAALDEEGGE